MVVEAVCVIEYMMVLHVLLEELCGLLGSLIRLLHLPQSRVVWDDVHLVRRSHTADSTSCRLYKGEIVGRNQTV